MFKRILIPLDSSKLAECVLPHLIAIAKISQSEVLLVHVIEPYDTTINIRMIDHVDWQIRKAEAESYLSAIAERLRNTGLSVSIQLLDGKSSEQIIKLAQSWNADLILMSSHGKSGLSPWSVSNIVQHVIMLARCSVMIVRAFQPIVPDITELRYRKIFLPLDGSTRAEMPLSLAESLVHTYHSVLLATTIVQQPQLLRRTTTSAEDMSLVNQLINRNQEEAAKYLEELRLRLDFPIETKLEVSSKVGLSLNQIADENEVDLTILCAHGYAGNTSWPYGSVVISLIIYGSTTLLILQDLPADRIQQTRAESVAQEIGGH
jgi:nucleotide-binding universal stress UspA family protein